MSEYHKIQSVFKRDKVTNRFIEGEWSTPELEYLHDKIWQWDEKIDGTNIRVVFDGETRRFGGRTDNASIPAHLIARLEDLFPVSKLRAVFPPTIERFPDKSVTLYGEGFGHKIESGGAYLGKDVDFCLFDVRVGRWWLRLHDVHDLAEKLGVRHAPYCGEGTILEAIGNVREGFRSAIGTAQAEGLILRPKVPLFDRSGQRIITKIKTRDFR